MKPIFKKSIICFLAALCCSALFLNWEGYAGVQVISGVSVLSVIIDLIVFILLFRPAKD